MVSLLLSKPQPILTSTVGLYTKMTLQPPPPPTTTHTNSMSGISQLLLTRCWWNFKVSFQGKSRTDSNYQVFICPGNICPGDISPYQEYLSCYWPNFDETLITQNFFLTLVTGNYIGFFLHNTRWRLHIPDTLSGKYIPYFIFRVT